MSDSPLHRMDPTSRFSERADAYARFRPDYPAAAIEAIFAAIGTEHPRIADVGAGTGISSAQLAARGARVIAVEPNEAMRERIPLVHGIETAGAPAERLPFEDGSLDAVTAFQAFHWFDPEPTLAEFERVLRPGGVVALVWNERDDADPFTASYGRAVRKASRNHPAERRLDHAAPFMASSRFARRRTLVFRHEQRLDAEGLVGRLRSTSYVPQTGEEWETLHREVHEAWSRFHDAQGLATLVYETVAHLGSVDG